VGISEYEDYADDVPDAWEDKELVLQSHRNHISRHRQQWQGPSTPPGYWDIGFPDTQQAAEINRRAQHLIEDKDKSIEQEARRARDQYILVIFV
jgi:hypothetical protein